jgi:hypothetical protein
LPPEKLLAQCEKTFLRRSGPGGQNRNKVETAVLLRHRTTGVSAEANERRSQQQNGEVALFRLRVALAVEIRAPRSTDSPSSLWRSRCSSGRIAVSSEHDDYPALLAEALDVLSAADWDVKSAGEILTVSRSQLIKFIKREPRAWGRLNDERESRGLARLL